jgi:hypothetical protein
MWRTGSCWLVRMLLNAPACTGESMPARSSNQFCELKSDEEQIRLSVAADEAVQLVSLVPNEEQYSIKALLVEAP